MLDYARIDSHYLIHIYDRLLKKLNFAQLESLYHQFNSICKMSYKKPKSSKSISHEPGLSLKQKSWIFGKRDPMEGTESYKMGHLPEFSVKRGAEFENFQRKMLSKNEKN